MGRLIDADWFKSSMLDEPTEWMTEEQCVQFRAMIDLAPTVDAVPVVQCRNCKSFSHGYCKFHDAKFVRPNGYCYWGERKDGDHHD